MKVRAIDDNNDWTFGRGRQDYKEDDKAVEQNVKTRLMSFYRDCFFDLEAGIDWFNLLGSRGTEKILSLVVKQSILGTDGVVSLNNAGIEFDRISRHITLSYDIKTVYSRSYKGEFVI